MSEERRLLVENLSLREKCRVFKQLLETIVTNCQHSDTRIPREFVDMIKLALKGKENGT